MLDPEQRRVVDHQGGPLLVLAGPGTGKTTTLVEAIVERIEGRGADPASVLALTFSRKAAEQLRDRVTARLGRTTSSPLCSTFHSFAYGLVRALLPGRPLRRPAAAALGSRAGRRPARAAAPTTPESVQWPDVAAPRAGHPRLRRARCTPCSPGHASTGSTRTRCAPGRRQRAPELVAAGLFLEQYLTNLDDQGATDYADLIRRAVIEAAAHRDELRAQVQHVFVDEYQDTDPGQVALLQALAGDGRNLVVVGDPHQSIYGFRGADVRGILDFPDTLPPPRRRSCARSSRCAGCVGSGRGYCSRLASGSPDSSPGAAPSTRGGAGRLRRRRVRRRGRTATGGSRSSPSTPTAPRPSTSPTCSAGPTSRTASPGTRWPCWCGRAARRIPGLRRSLGAAGVPVEVAADDVPLVADPAVAPLLDALRAALNLDDDDPAHVDFVDAGRAESLLLGPLGRARRRRRAPARAGCCASARRPVRSPTTSAAGRRASWSGSRSSTRASSTGSTVLRRRGRGRSAGCSPTPRPLLAAGRPPRRCSGSSGPPRRGPTGCAAQRRPGEGRLGGRTATSTRCAPCSRRRRARRSGATTVASATSWPPSPRSSSPRTRWPSGACAGPPYACSPRTAPRVWSGGSSSSRTSSRRAGPTCAGGRRCCRPTGSAARYAGTPLVQPPTTAASCSPRSVGCSTSPAPAPGSDWWSPRSPHPTTTASSPHGSSPSSASTRPGCSAGPSDRCRSPAWSPSCAVPWPTRGVRPVAARCCPSALPTRGRDQRSATAGAAGRPGVVVGHSRCQPFGDTGPSGRRAGADLGEPARVGAGVPGPVVPRP